MTNSKEGKLGYCPNCFKEHGNTVEEKRPHHYFKNSFGMGFEQLYVQCKVCGKKELITRKRNPVDYNNFNFEDYEYDPQNHTE